MKNSLLPRRFRNPVWLENQLKVRDAKKWQRLGRDRAITLFHEMAERVPAYKDFLKKHKIDHKEIKRISDFRQLPTIDKDNYLRAYPREALCWDGKFKESSWTISSTSGSSGQPYYFPRQSLQDWQYAITAEQYLRTNFDIENRSTLYIVAFPMGAWIGGVFTYEALKIITASERYNISIITPGINKKEIIESIKQLGKDFDQIIIGCYGPFLKDILDDGEKEGIRWKDYKLGFIFSAEVFNELFRDYVIKKTGLKSPYKSTLNHYGTVDLGTMAHETPLSILLRRLAIDDENLYKSFFARKDKLPTFAQYNPALFYFEEDDGQLYCSSYSGIPLVRYDLKDAGGVVSYSSIKNILNRNGYDFHKLLVESEIENTVWKLPFVYVYERSDFSVSFYAFQIYAEMIRRPLQHEALQREVTSKFSARVYYDVDGQQKFEVNVELKNQVSPSQELSKKIQSAIAASLLDESSEYRETYRLYGNKIFPEIILWPYEDEKYFKSGTKQKWVVK